jgi:hypothetical protein
MSRVSFKYGDEKSLMLGTIDTVLDYTITFHGKTLEDPQPTYCVFTFDITNGHSLDLSVLLDILCDKNITGEVQFRIHDNETEFMATPIFYRYSNEIKNACEIEVHFK